MVVAVLSLLVGLISVYQLNYLLIHLNYDIHTLRRRMAVIVQNSACASGTIYVPEASLLSRCSYKQMLTIYILTINYTALAHPALAHMVSKVKSLGYSCDLAPLTLNKIRSSQ